MLSFGNERRSIDDWAKKLGLNAATIRSRLATYKWSIADTLTLKPRERSQKIAMHLVMDGERGTVAYWSEKTGINQATIRSRLQRFWSIKKALTTPPDSRFRHKGGKDVPFN
jgi:DNA-binding protein Fis